jgi:hypothetical protein
LGVARALRVLSQVSADDPELCAQAAAGPAASAEPELEAEAPELEGGLPERGAATATPSAARCARAAPAAGRGDDDQREKASLPRSSCFPSLSDSESSDSDSESSDYGESGAVDTEAQRAAEDAAAEKVGIVIGDRGVTAKSIHMDVDVGPYEQAGPDGPFEFKDGEIVARQPAIAVGLRKVPAFTLLLRVSGRGQMLHGAGLSTQLEQCFSYLTGKYERVLRVGETPRRGEKVCMILKCFVEVGSGCRNSRSRPQLTAAVRSVKSWVTTGAGAGVGTRKAGAGAAHAAGGAWLLVARSDRLAREVGVLTLLRDEGVQAVPPPGARCLLPGGPPRRGGGRGRPGAANPFLVRTQNTSQVWGEASRWGGRSGARSLDLEASLEVEL